MNSLTFWYRKCTVISDEWKNVWFDYHQAENISKYDKQLEMFHGLVFERKFIN